MARLRIALVEDQPLYRDMLVGLLRAVPDFDLVVAAGSAAETAGFPRDLDVALLDITLPDGDGIEVGRRLQERQSSLSIVLLSAVDRLNTLLDVPEEQRRRWSYLSKTSALSAPSLVSALRASAGGRSVLDRELVERRRARPRGRLAALSTRQFEVLTLLAEGLTNTAIARRLNLADRSVDNHVNAVYSALGLGGDAERNPRVSAVRIFLEESA
ncbi:LuxR C-terminal-related transcriptional regulator [Microbacterium sp. SORGH_AS_0862]|uniref:response regulator transcription factor n=1 Tax=Microbacterium sp. SORGH_AS_0862 TaxID=3041789 RepID=UPI002790A4E2|nr:response regulator transcription factor [Microbacterium sp. SORGH_AS_0862]MDQ1204416.1 DNA-binding NarL/FixJ family response regulator [Microbacterium sp. SORGH_AS_0862]